MDAQDRINVLRDLTGLALGYRDLALRTLAALDAADGMLSTGDVAGARAVIAGFHDAERSAQTESCHHSPADKCRCAVNEMLVRQAVPR